MADGAVIVAPSGYERGWNVNNGKSKVCNVNHIDNYMLVYRLMTSALFWS